MCYHIAPNEKRKFEQQQHRKFSVFDKVAGINIQLADISDFHIPSQFSAHLLEHHKSFAGSGFAPQTMQFTVNNKSNKSSENLRNSSRRFIILAVELLCKWGMTALSIKIYLFFHSVCVCMCVALCCKMWLCFPKYTGNKLSIKLLCIDGFNAKCKFY